MKFLKKHFEMETVQVPSLQLWLGHELESRGIDSLIYSRHIIQILQQDDDDPDGVDFYDFLYEPKITVETCRGKTGRKSEKRKSVSNTEDRKKSAAIECLQAVSEENSDIEVLVEELCSKLKEINNSSGVEDTFVASSSSSSSSENSDSSSPELEDPAERYYAAFPALQGQEQHDNTTEFPSPYSQDAVFVWQNNPITKNIGDGSIYLADSGNESEKENLNKPSEDCPRKKHHSLNSSHSTNKKKKSPRQPRRKKQSRSNGYEKHNKICRFLSWPQAHHQQLETGGDLNYPVTNEKERELCYQVENLLKKMLIPVSGSPYLYPSDLAGVDYDSEDACIRPKPSDKPQKNNQPEERVSPELQEKEIWYTQPIDDLFCSEKSCRKRLYKRHSCPSFQHIGDFDFDGDVYPSTMSSPVRCDFSTDDLVFTTSPQVSVDEDSFGLQSLMVGDDGLNDSPMSSLHNKPRLYNRDKTLSSDTWKNNDFYPQHGDCSFYSDMDSSVFETPNSLFAGDEDVFQSSSAFHILNNAFFSNSTCNSSKSAASSHSSASGVTITENESHLSFSCHDNEFITSAKEEQSLYLDPSLGNENQSYSLLDPGPSLKSFYNETCVGPAHGMEMWDSLWSNGDENKRLTVGTQASQLWDVNYQGKSHWEAVCPWNKRESDGQSNSHVGSICFTNDQNQDPEQCNQNGTNTLIPVITFALVTDESAGETLPNNEFECHGLPLSNSSPRASIDRSVSLNELQLCWSTSNLCAPKSPLSRSFELVPSERSAFDDVVPKRLLHAQSEPDLKRLQKNFEISKFSCWDMTVKTKQKERIQQEDNINACSPEEHLYFSSKTHFQPIHDPADKIGGTTNSDSSESLNDFHLRDLFGGYCKTSKTPYQKYQDMISDSGEETFVPMFKIVKEHEKYIQTNASPEQEFSNGPLPDWGTICDKCGNICLLSPNFEAIALAENQACNCFDLFQGVLEDFDIHGYVDSLTASEQNTPQNIPDNQNTCSDSGYEDFDIGASDDNRIVRNVRTHEPCEKLPVRGKFEYLTLEKDSGEKEVFSQENGWVMYEMKDINSEEYDGSSLFVDRMQNQVMLGFSKENVGLRDDDYSWNYSGTLNMDQIQVPHEQNPEGDTVQLQAKPLEDNVKDMEDKGTETQTENTVTDVIHYSETEIQTSDVETLGCSNDDSNEPVLPIDRQDSNISDDTVVNSVIECQNVTQTDQENSCFSSAIPTTIESAVENADVICTSGREEEGCSLKSDCCSTNESAATPEEQIYKTVTFKTDESQEVEDDVVKIKLVFHRGRSSRTEPGYGLEYIRDNMNSVDGQTFMPMPSKAVYSADLEKEWLNGKQIFPDFQKVWKSNSSNKGSKRKPCTFFMEGNCRRVDCKFAHDLSTITCRFWEEGDCFKADMCPFLHGYYSSDTDSQPSSQSQKKFDYKAEDFPGLATSSKEEKISKNICVKKALNDSKAQYLRSRKVYRKSKPGEKVKLQNDKKISTKSGCNSTQLPEIDVGKV